MKKFLAFIKMILAAVTITFFLFPMHFLYTMSRLLGKSAGPKDKGEENIKKESD